MTKRTLVDICRRQVREHRRLQVLWGACSFVNLTAGAWLDSKMNLAVALLCLGMVGLNRVWWRRWQRRLHDALQVEQWVR